MRGASSEEVEELLEGDEGAPTGDFLDEIVQMEGVQGEHVYDKRVQQRYCSKLRRTWNVILLFLVHGNGDETTGVNFRRTRYLKG